MESLSNVIDSFGVHIDAKSQVVRTTVSLLVIAGVISFIRPFISLVRVLLSLFVLPGQSVCIAINGI
jgi:17beta-estradiol 17-dehydrogenase / very-long-chain 3-oxoacyl-CoA reductase